MNSKDICIVLRQQLVISYNLLVFVDYIIMNSMAAFGQSSLFFMRNLNFRKH